jgi:hypothetical protein
VPAARPPDRFHLPAEGFGSLKAFTKLDSGSVSGLRVFHPLNAPHVALTCGSFRFSTPGFQLATFLVSSPEPLTPALPPQHTSVCPPRARHQNPPIFSQRVKLVLRLCDDDLVLHRSVSLNRRHARIRPNRQPHEQHHNQRQANSRVDAQRINPPFRAIPFRPPPHIAQKRRKNRHSGTDEACDDSRVDWNRESVHAIRFLR